MCRSSRKGLDGEGTCSPAKKLRFLKGLWTMVQPGLCWGREVLGAVCVVRKSGVHKLRTGSRELTASTHVPTGQLATLCSGLPPHASPSSQLTHLSASACISRVPPFALTFPL